MNDAGDARLVVVGEFPTRIDAEMAQGALETDGIESAISADDAGGQYASLWLSGVRLLVRSEDVKRASEILGPRS